VKLFTSPFYFHIPLEEDRRPCPTPTPCLSATRACARSLHIFLSVKEDELGTLSKRRKAEACSAVKGDNGALWPGEGGTSAAVPHAYSLDMVE
jgi:hypothetical protein